MYDHLLIDGRNMLYRAAYTALGDLRFRTSGHHAFNIVLHFISYYFNQFQPKHIHLFWDSPRREVWRKSLLQEYKENRSDRDPDASYLIDNLYQVTVDFLQQMGIRQYNRNNMEADDLIYAFCRVNHQTKNLIISSDTDLKQISFFFPNVDLHNPLAKRHLEPIPEYDLVVYKALVGDKSDNILGYDGIGPVRGRVLTENLEKRKEFFRSKKAVVKINGDKVFVGDQRFKDNLKIIDLSLCPDLVENMSYVFNNQFSTIQFEVENLINLISKYKLRGVLADLNRYVLPLKRLIEDGS